jgi:hypothetical protein
VSHRWFGRFAVVLIAANSVVLSLDHYPADAAFAARMEELNFGLLCAFTVEMAMKLGGLGRAAYLADSFNAFDGAIVLVGWVEFVVLPPSFVDPAAAGGGGALSALRTFRVFRVFKLARDWHSLRILLHTIAETLSSVANFAVLLLLFMYIYSLLGMQFFGNKFHFYPTFDRLTETASSEHDVSYYKMVPFDACSSLHTGQPSAHCDYDDATLSRSHYDDMLWAFVTTFQVRRP